MNNRAYSVLHVKAVEEDARVIRGIATTPSPDRVGDIVDPEGVKFQNPMPLLWQHQHDMPVGTVKFNKPTKDGITFEARFAKAEQSQTLKDRIDEAWESVKLGLVSAVSIGFHQIGSLRIVPGDDSGASRRGHHRHQEFRSSRACLCWHCAR